VLLIKLGKSLSISLYGPRNYILLNRHRLDVYYSIKRKGGEKVYRRMEKQLRYLDSCQRYGNIVNRVEGRFYDGQSKTYF
jgi:hypothetical protein